MSNHQDYMDSRMLHAFMDGELGGAQEEVLFHKLSGDASLRAEMQDHLSIRKAVQHDIEAFTPPASATTAIFATLGFTIPSTSATAAAGGTTIARGFMFGGAAAALILATAVFLFWLFPFASDPAQGVVERVVSSPSSVVVIEEPASVPDLPLSDTRSAHSAFSAAAPASGVSNRSAASNSSAASDASARAIAPAAIAERTITPRDMELLASAIAEPGEPQRVRTGQVQFYDLIPKPDGVTLYARNVALRSDPAPTVVSQSEPWFRNVNLGLMYALDDHHSIGIEGGREPFSQHFSGVNDLGLNVRIEQNPLAYWATAVYQFTGDPLLPHVHPFVQLQAGGAFELGGLGRATIGLKFRPYDRIAVIVGAEGGMLLYRFQRNWFTTNKLGLTYGLTFEF